PAEQGNQSHHGQHEEAGKQRQDIVVSAPAEPGEDQPAQQETGHDVADRQPQDPQRDQQEAEPPAADQQADNEHDQCDDRGGVEARGGHPATAIATDPTTQDQVAGGYGDPASDRRRQGGHSARDHEVAPDGPA